MEPDGRYYDFEKGGDYIARVKAAQITNGTRKDEDDKKKDLTAPTKPSAIDPPNEKTHLTWGQRWKGMEKDGRYYDFEEPGDHHKKAPTSSALLQLKEYPQPTQNVHLGYEGQYVNDRRSFEFEEPGDY